VGVLAFVATAAISSEARAQEPHSWCVTGAPLVLDGSTDPTTNDIIAEVCEQSGTADCCATGGRWRLECVQRAASYANYTLLIGDVCGRFVWEIPITGTEIRFPRDFNLVALSGDVSGIRDVGGPIATAGQLTAYAFHLNYGQRDNTALFAQQGVNIGNGEIYGSIAYDGNFISSGVTFMDGWTPGTPSQPFPIQFQGRQTSLSAMSNSIAFYDAIPAIKEWSTLSFIGSDPELNVFSVDADDLLTTYDYNFEVPLGSSAIINVFGANPEIKYAGFRGTFSAGKLLKMLWNFPNATTLTLRSVGFPGSILAPLADADMRDGAVSGTVVVTSAIADVELYMAPFDPPSVGGCLAFDELWSCSDDTKVDHAARALALEPEAGFLQIPSEDYIAEGVARSSPTHRVWYSFHPARQYPKDKPLAVFFNGGPASATSTGLFALNTGPKTLDPDTTGDNQTIALNTQADWSDFANLLYIDAPTAGFSYPINENPDVPSTDIDLGIDMDRDAAIFLQVVTRFLGHHPALLNNGLILVGESYGGARATLMFYHLFHYPDLIEQGSSFQDAQLYADLTDYFRLAFPTETPTSTELATLWGHQVLIQAGVAGNEQYQSGQAHFPYFQDDCVEGCWLLSPDEEDACDLFNCDQVYDYRVIPDQTVYDRLTTVSTLQNMLGVDPTTIAWMHADARVNAFGRKSGPSSVDTPDMYDKFGELVEDDSYLVIRNLRAFETYLGARRWSSPGAGELSAIQFALNLHQGVKTFVTVARYDYDVPTVGIYYAIRDFVLTESTVSNFVQSVGYDPGNTFFDLPRPGLMTLNYQPDGNYQVPIAMPHYYEAGHMVSHRAPVALKEDVMQWYLDSLQ